MLKLRGMGEVYLRFSSGNEGKKWTVRPRRRCMKHSCIKVYLKGTGWVELDWLHLAMSKN